MSSKIEFREENSEKELQDAYKKFKLTEVPDLWDDIERNLAPKPPKKRAAVKKWAALAAAVLMLAVLVPVLGNIGKKEAEHNFDMAGIADNESAEARNEPAAAEDESGEPKMESDEGKEGQHADGGMMEDSKMDLDTAENTALQLEIKVLKIGASDEPGTVSAEVILDESGAFQAGEIISLNYEAETIPERELTGIVRVRAERTGEKIKILEIVP